MKTKLLIFSLLVTCHSSLVTIIAAAAEPTLEWLAGENAPVATAGYKLHIGKTSGNYTETIDLGNVNKVYFALGAYNADGIENPTLSKEAVYTIPSPSPTPKPSPTATPSPSPSPSPSASPAWTGRLRNISTRGLVGTGDNVMIAGFIVEDASVKIAARVLGPSLTKFGLAGALPDPMLELRDSKGALLAWNNAGEAAVTTTLAPGAYTVIVRGKNNTTGVALVEVNQVP
jgi:hypothetical protein